MPTFKQYLDALFKTRTTPAEAAQAAMPDNESSISLSFQDGADVTYTAPDNGYLCLGAKPNEQGRSFIACWGGVETTVDGLTGDAIGNIAVYCPVLKGQTKWLQFSKGRFAKFVRASASLGGGYRSLLATLQSGGEICLRLKNTFAHFLNSPVLRQCRGITQRILRSQKAASGLKAPSHRMMGMRCSATIKPKLWSLLIEQQVCDLEAHQQPMQAFSFQSRKETFLQEWPPTRQRKTHAFALFRLSALPNLCANCEEVRHVA